MERKIGKKLLIGFSGIAILAMCGCSNTLISNKNNMCDAVKEYLASADFEGQGQAVQKGDNIVVDYIGRLADGTVFDTSVESVAKGCGTYNEGRNYDEGLAFNVGAGQMIAGFDKGVEGMKIGQTRTIEIKAKDAYGEWNESLDFEVEKSKLQNPGQYVEGLAFYDENANVVRVYKVDDKKVYFTYNPELAGKDLIFDITIKEIK